MPSLPTTPNLAEATDPAQSPVEERVKITGALRRLLVWILPANLIICIIWGSVPSVLLPLQIASIDPVNRVGTLAIITTVGALIAMIAQPLVGVVSDRTRSRYGRRARWMIVGALVGGLGMVGVGLANSVVQIGIAYIIVQIGYNFVQGPVTAILPDRVPQSLRGTFSALAGIGVMFGALGGQAVGAALSSNIPVAYLVLAGALLVVMVLFVVFNPDRSSLERVVPRFQFGDFLRSFWVNPVAHPDFFWAFVGRLFLYTGYFSVVGYQLYILQDYIGLGDSAVAALPLFGLVGLVGILIATGISGPLSDRIGRRKVFVFGSSIVIGVAMLIPLFAPTFTGWLIFQAVVGLGFGMFQAVDQALITEVLPSSDHYGKDLGVVNIAATLPQTFAPAVGGAVVLLFHGYGALFPVGAVLAVLGAVAVWLIKSVR